VARTFIELCACAGDPELDAPLPATPARDLYLNTWHLLSFAHAQVILNSMHRYRDLYPTTWRGHLLSFAHAQVILNSMHRYQPRLHVICIPPRGEDIY
jgi:hypothetical protein